MLSATSPGGTALASSATWRWGPSDDSAPPSVSGTRPIVTRLEKLSGFYPAEDYHQDFAVLHPTYPYIVFNDAPKVENLKRLFAASYREMPVTVMAATKTGH